LAVVNPTADRTITLPNVTGTVVTTGDTGSVTSTMILDGTILNADVNASAAIAGTKISPDFGSQNIATTGVFSHALGTAGSPTITFTGNTNTGIYSPAADTLAFTEGGTEAMRIDSSGRLLVGTSTARSNFFNSTNTALVQIEGFPDLALTRTANDQFSSNFIFAKTRSSGNTIVQNNDILGLLSFQGSDGSEFVEGAFIQAQVDGTPGANDMPGRLVFSTTADGASSPTERMRISADGSVRCAGTLQINGGNLAITQNSPRQDFTTASGWAIRFVAGGVGGVDLSPNATAWSAVSDERLKTNLKPITNSLDKVGLLRAVTGRYLTDEVDVSRSFLIAQDVQAVLPEAVSSTTDDDDQLSLRYTEVIPLLVAALKESKERIETLEARLTAAGIE